MSQDKCLVVRHNRTLGYIERMDTFLNKHDILSPSQYGFRSNMSTSQALLELIEEITSSLDNKKYSVGIFIDLKGLVKHCNKYISYESIHSL